MNEDTISKIKKKVRKISVQITRDKRTFEEEEIEREMSLREKEDLEECREIFIINQAVLKGRRNALHEDLLLFQIFEWKRKRKLKHAECLNEIDLNEMRKILHYQMEPRRMILESEEEEEAYVS